MAVHGLMLKCTANLVFLRSFQIAKHTLRKCQYSSSKVLCRNDQPVKYTTSSAAKISIAETTGLAEEKTEHRIRRMVVLGSLTVFILYFLILREENDIDAILSGDPSARPEEVELIDLKLKLSYCQKVGLPTEKIRERIEEISKRHYKPVFTK